MNDLRAQISDILAHHRFGMRAPCVDRFSMPGCRWKPDESATTPWSTQHSDHVTDLLMAAIEAPQNADQPPIGDQAVAFVREHLDVELTDWQEAYLRALYAPLQAEDGATDV